MLKSKEVKLGTGILLLCFATAINACTPAVKEGQPAINPSISPPAGNAKNEAVLTATPYSEVLRQNTPAEIAAWTPASVAAAKSSETPTAASASPAAAERPADTPTTQPTKKPTTATPFPPTKVPDTATAVATAPATAAATAPAKVEAPRFRSWGVYEGIAKNGGGVVFVTLPNGDVIFSSMIQEPRCTISGNVSGYYEFVFDAKGKYQIDRDNFAFPAGSARTKVIRVDLKNGETAEGSILEKGYSATSPKGPLTCPANEVKFTAKLVGEGDGGKEAFIQAWGNAAVAGGFDKPTRNQVISGIEDAFGKLPD